MSKPPEGVKPERPSRTQSRVAREAAALRANLSKRKDQARLREESKPKPDR